MWRARRTSSSQAKLACAWYVLHSCCNNRSAAAHLPYCPSCQCSNIVFSCNVQDEVIHKKVFRIVGSIPAVNFLKVPKDKPLGLPGRFLYLQVKASTPSSVM